MIPSIWQNLGPVYEMDAFLVPEEGQIGVGVATRRLPPNSATQQGSDPLIGAMMLQFTATVPEYERVSFGRSELAGATIYRHLYRTTIAGVRSQQVQYYYPVAGTLHIVPGVATVETFDARLPLIESIVASYRIGVVR